MIICMFRTQRCIEKPYRKSGTRDLGCLQMGPWDNKMSRWDPGPGFPEVELGTQDSKMFKLNRDFQFCIVLIVYSTLNTLHFTITKLCINLFVRLTKLCINLFVRLTYFMVDTQKQPLRCVINFKEL